MGVVSEVAQSVAESLLGKNSSGFTKAMKGRQDSPEAKLRSQKRSLGNKGANDTAPLPSIPGATGNQEAKMARTGGRISKSGRVKLHRGEMVARKTQRSKCRGGRR